jgi:hypothetical protein
MNKYIFCCFLFLPAASFGSSFTFYTSQSDFQAAIAGFQQQTITFDNLATGDYAPLVTSGVTFTGDIPPQNGLQIKDQASWTLPFLGSATGNSLLSGVFMSATLPSRTSAVGFLVGSTVVTVLQFSEQEQLTAGAGVFSVTATPANPFPFIGVVADGPIASVSISGASLLTIDNFTFASVPEPSSALLSAIPLAVLGVCLRFKR